MNEDVFIRLVADAGGFSTGMKKAEGATDALKEKVKKSNDEVKNLGQNDALENFKKGLLGASSITDKFNEQMKKLGGVLGAAFAVGAVVAFGKSSIEAFMEAEKSAKKLQFAVDMIAGEKGAFPRMLSMAKELMGTSIFSHEQIEEAQTIALQYGMTTAQVSKLIPKIIDLASATGMNLPEAMSKVIRGIEGQQRGLKVLGLGFADTGDKTQNLNILMDNMGKFTGAAGISLETAAGKLAHMKNQFDETKEAIGGFLLKAFDPLIKGAGDLVRGLEKITETPISSKLEEEREGLNRLVLQLQDTNISEEDRRQLILKIKKEYPDFLKGLSDEKITNEELAIRLGRVNDAYVLKIRLSKSQETLTKLAEEEAKYVNKLADARQAEADAMIKLQPLLYQGNAAAAAAIEGAATMQEKIDLVKKYFGVTGNDFLIAAQKAVTMKLVLQGAQREYAESSLKIAENAINASLNITNSLDSVSDEILKAGKNTKDAVLQSIINAELLERSRTKIKEVPSHLGLTPQEEAKRAKEAEDRQKAADEMLKKVIEEDTAHLKVVMERRVKAFQETEYKPQDAEQLQADYDALLSEIESFNQDVFYNSMKSGADLVALDDEQINKRLELQKWFNEQKKKLNEKAGKDYIAFLNEEEVLSKESLIENAEAFKDKKYSPFATEQIHQDANDYRGEIRLTYDWILAQLEASHNAGIISDENYSKERIDIFQRMMEKIKGITETEKTQIEGNQKHGFNLIASIFGLKQGTTEGDEQIKAIENAFSKVQAATDMFVQQQINSQQKIVDAANQRISEQENAVRVEEELLKAGEANNLSIERDKLSKLKAQRDQALEEQRKWQKAQQLIQIAAQASSLVTAGAELFAAHASLPIIGVVMAIGFIATMMSAIMALKSQAAQVSQAREGGSFMLNHGRYHSDGGINLGNGLEVERGESLHVLQRGKGGYYDFLAGVTRAINTGQLSTSDMNVISHEFLSRQRFAPGVMLPPTSLYAPTTHAQNLPVMQVELKEVAEIREMRDLMKQLVNQGTVTQVGDTIVERRGNNTRIIHK